MNKVLVPMAIRHERSGTGVALHVVRATYIRQLGLHGLFPLFISPAMPPELIASAYCEASGLLLMGGGDVDARLYGSSNHAKTDRAEPKRDIVELALARMAIRDRMPILGICRGCQVLAIASGGALYQHLPDLHLDEEHGIGAGGTYDDLLVRAGHEVFLEEGSVARRLLGARITMNTGHHQAVQSVGSSFFISGRTIGGVTECIEHRDSAFFCMGVQGHPEVGGTAADALFGAFARAVHVCSRLESN